MTLPRQINDREHDKFLWDTELGTVVKTLTKIFGGEITILSPQTFKVTTIKVTDTPTLLPRTPGSLAVDFRNMSETVTVYKGPENSVTADLVEGTTSGWQIGPGEGDNFSLLEQGEIWLVAPATKEALFQFREWIKP